MQNGDLSRFYPLTEPVREDFVRLEDGKIPSKLLPSYVDDVVEGYYYDNKFYEDALHTKEIVGEKGKIYIDLVTNISYRWSGTQFVAISFNNYNSLDNKPIINADLDAENFIPEIGNYYRHTGTGGEASGTAFAQSDIGQLPSDLYLKKSFDYATYLPTLTYVDGLCHLIETDDDRDGILSAYKLEDLSEEGIIGTGYAIGNQGCDFYYATDSFTVEGEQVNAGWQSKVDASGKANYGTPSSLGEISSINETAGWNGIWASKTAFEPSSQYTTGTIYKCTATSPATYVAINGIDASTLSSYLQGSIGVIADLNQANTKVDIHLDMTGASADKVLTVNSDSNGVEWKKPLPDTSGHLGEYLYYSTTGIQWNKAVYSIGGSQDVITLGSGLAMTGNQLNLNPPAVDGTYKLQCVVSNGVPTISWVTA